jgi:hypothetical protein
MKKILLGIGLVVVLGVITFYAISEPLPEGTKGGEAEVLAQKVLKAIDIQAWDTTKYITWTFRDAHTYRWDRIENRAIIEWDDITVAMDLDQVKSKVYREGKLITDPERTEIHNKAWSIWCNDSFWLNAPSKIYDPGTVRSVVDLDSGGKGLLVQYTSGGTTPGDAYLWILDQNNLPTAYKMWVSIIPIGGLEASWEDWITIHSGAKIAGKHKIGPLEVPIGAIQSGENPASINWEEDLFM